MIPDSFYSYIAYDKDDYENGPTLDWIKANRALIDQIVTTALQKTMWGLQRVDEIRDATNDGVSVHLVRNHYAKCCLVDTEYLDMHIKWEDILTGRTDTVIDNAWHDQHEQERLKREKDAKEAALRKEAADRAEFERLKTKYATQ